MRSRDFLRRIGLGGEPADARFTFSIVLLTCLLYTIGFAAFYPDIITNDDESAYTGQTQLLVEGTASIPRINPLTDETEAYSPKPYPYGTALLMAPFVALAGWKGAYMVGFLSLMIGTLLLARWLHEEGRSPIFAFLLLGYPPALVMARVAMSDVPSTMLVTLGLWLFWRGLDRGWLYWLASGFIAGGSLMFRESNPIPFAPFFAGAVLRREKHCWALVVGGLAGLSLRLGSNLLVFGEPLFYKAAYRLALGTMDERLPVYLLAMLVFVPGGLILSLCYRGRRWPELCAAVALFVLAYLVQRYYTFGTSPVKRMITTPRYLLPIVPVMAFGMAESVPRLWRRFVERRAAAGRSTFEAPAAALLMLWVAAITVAAFSVHWAFHRWSTPQIEIREAINAEANPNAVLVTNWMATRKYLRELDRKYLTMDRQHITVEDAIGLVDRYGEIYIVFLERGDSDHWRQDEVVNAKFIADMKPPPTLLLDRETGVQGRLRIWRVTAAGRDPH